MEFAISKLVGFFLSPIYILIFLQLIYVFFYFKKKKKYKKITLLTILISILFFGNIGISSSILNTFEKEFSKPKNDINEITGLIILGGPLEEASYHNSSEIALNGQVERLTVAIELYNLNNNLKLLYSGFSNKVNPKSSEAVKAKIFFEKMGVKTENIILEDKSKNTLENIIYSKKILEDLGGDWYLITSAFHMKRAIFLAEKFNLKVIPYPVDWQIKKKGISFFSYNFRLSFRYWEIIFHELAGILYYNIKIK